MDQDTKKQLLSTLTLSERTRMALFKVVLTECVIQRSVDHTNGIYEEGPFLANLANDILSHPLTKTIYSEFTIYRMKGFISSKVRSGEIEGMTIDSNGIRIKGLHPQGLQHPEHMPVKVNEVALHKSFKGIDKSRLTLTNMWNEIHGKKAA